MTRLTRRQFLRLAGATAAGMTILGAGCTTRPTETTGDTPDPSDSRQQPPTTTGDQAY